jgi:hypothetical protein
MDGVLVLMLVWVLLALPVAIVIGMAIRRAEVNRCTTEAANHVVDVDPTPNHVVDVDTPTAPPRQRRSPRG